MGQTKFKSFATIATLLLILSMAFTLIFGLCDAHIFTTIDIGYAADASTEAIDDYYAEIEALDSSIIGADFRTYLARLIGPSSNGGTHKKLTSYDDLKTVYKTSDIDSSKGSGYIRWFYTGTSEKYTGAMGSEAGTTNREHIWAKKGGKAYKDTTSNVGSDAHHLRPCEAQLNSDRGEKQYDDVATIPANIQRQANSKNYTNPCYTSGNIFYPGDGYRGATARILMYVETRWGNTYGLSFSNKATGNSDKEMGNIATLLKWHFQEPPTEDEKIRNEAVYKIQGNRNPFIDHPEYASIIYCNDGKGYNKDCQAIAAQWEATEPVQSIAFDKTSATLTTGATLFLQTTVTPSNAKRDFVWTSSNTNVATVDNSGRVLAKSAGRAEITVYSESNNAVKATMTIVVKEAKSISVSGTPSKTVYNDGETFVPNGLIVKAIFDDDSTDTIDVTDCQWLDGTTRGTSLSAGTTSVICKYGTFEAIVNGIVVNKVEGGGKITLTQNSFNFDNKTSYDWVDWTSNGIAGKGYIVKNSDNTIQMNQSKNYTYFYNTTAIPGKILSITLKLGGTKNTGSDKTFDIRTSSTPFGVTNGSKYPSTGTSHGEQIVTSSGTTWTLNTSDNYFAICYTASKNAVYLESIEIIYGSQGSEECDHAWSAWTITKEATATENGEKTRTCSKCNKVEKQEIPATGIIEGSYTAEDFINAVNAIDQAETIEEKQAALDFATNIFNSLTTDEVLKDECQNAYSQLIAKRSEIQRMKNSPATLSGGEIAGIVIGCVVFAAAVTVLVLFLVKQKRKNSMSRS